MKKIISLLKAVLSNDMNLFKYQTGKNSSSFKKIVFPIFLFFLVIISIGAYAYQIALILNPIHLNFVLLSMFLAISTILTFVEGIYKSQGILFECRDNDLLFSLPIKKSMILFIRVFKLLLFEFLYNLMFLLPAIFVYAYFEKPGISFYLLSIFMTIMIPILPTILASFLGYMVKLLSEKFKSKKLVQTLFTSIIFLGIFFLSLNTNGVFKYLGENANGINDLVTKFYYPIDAYLSLLTKFDIIIFLKLIAVHVIPFFAFIILGQKYYFSIISSSKNNNYDNNQKKVIWKSSKPIISLIKKELKRYFSSPVYMFNTSFGLLLIFVFTIILCFKGKDEFILLLANYGVNNSISIEHLFYGLILFSLSFTSISSASISLEGKTIAITKSLPIDYKIIFQSKILTCFIIELPLVILSELLFLFKFDVGFVFFVELLLIPFIIIFITGVIGLIFNLKYPKLNASSDTEVVKQSMSSMISLFLGFGIFIISMLLFILLNDKLNFIIIILIQQILLIILGIVLYFLLMKNGPREYQKLN